MALTGLTFADLQNAVSDWTVRPDLTPAQIKDAVYMFESEVGRRLHVRETETSADLTTTDGVVALPAGYIAWRGLTWNGAVSKELDYAHPTAFHAIFNTEYSDDPQWFTIEGDNLVIKPIDDTTDAFTLRYYAGLTHLSGDSDTNWLLTDHPDLYLSGSLYETYKFLRDAEAAQAYKAIMEEGLQQVIDGYERDKAPAELRIVGTVA